MCLARVEEVPVVTGMFTRELVEQRTLCCAVRSGERAEFEHDAFSAPQLRQADALAVEQRQLTVGCPVPGMEHVGKGAELALVLPALDVGVEALVVVRGAHQLGRDVVLRIAFVVVSMATAFATSLFRQRSASDRKSASTARPRRFRSPEDVSGRVPITVLWSNMHIERSPQYSPTPTASRTALWEAMPIDISSTEIAWLVVRLTLLPMMSVAEECVVMPCCPPTTVQPSTMLIPRSMLKEMSMPWPWLFPSMSTVQLRITTPARRTWMPSSFAPCTVTPSITVPRTPSTEIPFSPPTTVTLRICTSSCATTIPPRTTAPGSPCSTSRRSITSGPRWTPALRCTTGGSRTVYIAAEPPNARTRAAAATPPIFPSSPPSSA